MKPYDNYTFLLLSEEERLEEWNEIEDLVIQYQMYFNDPEESYKSKEYITTKILSIVQILYNID